MKRMFQTRITSVKQGIDRCYKGFFERFPRISRFLGFIRRRRRPLKGLLGLVFSIQAVMQTRTEQGAVAWAFALNTVPLVAVPGWLVFGNSKVDLPPGTGLRVLMGRPSMLMRRITDHGRSIQNAPRREIFEPPRTCPFGLPVSPLAIGMCWGRLQCE